RLPFLAKDLACFGLMFFHRLQRDGSIKFLFAPVTSSRLHPEDISIPPTPKVPTAGLSPVLPSRLDISRQCHNGLNNLLNWRASHCLALRSLITSNPTLPPFHLLVKKTEEMKEPQPTHPGRRL